MSEQHEASKRVIIEALVLVFSRSKISKLVGTDALRTVLTAEYRQHVSAGKLNFEPLWTLLEAQPGFDPQLAAAPICRFKTWEKLFGLQVILPPALSSLSDTEIREQAMSCDVPAKELQALLRSQTTPPPDDISLPANSAAARRAEKAKRIGRESGSLRARKSVASQPKNRRKILQIGAIAVTVVAFGIAGARLYKGCNPEAEYQVVSISTLSQVLPISKTDRLGGQVRAHLSNDGWLSKDEAARKADLQAAFAAVQPTGANALLIYDTRGALKASVQPLSATALSFKFY